MDEFDGAFDVYRLKTQIPYKDFKPYKTVLGYYVQLPPLLMTRDGWSGLMMVKSEMALINTAMMLLGAFWLGRIFRRSAVICALLLLTVMSTYLERSSALRVDMMTAWAGFLALLFLLAEKEKWSGFFAGLSFLISQKGIFYIAAGNSALLVHFFWFEREKEMFRRLVLFNLCMLVPIASYFAFWGILTSFTAANQATFFSHHDIVFKKIYDIRLGYWMQTVRRNPIFYIFTFFGLGLLFLRSIGRHSPCEEAGYSFNKPQILWVFGANILTCGLWYRQPWPYFFVILIPTFFVLVVAFFHYYLPKTTSWRQFFSRPLVIVFILLGFIYPLNRLIVVLGRDNGYQRHMVRIGNALLEEGEYYISGVDILYSRKHASVQLRRLGKVRRQNLNLSNPENIQKIISDLEEVTPKFIIANYRTKDLPDSLKEYFQRTFAHFWGSIYLYAPEIQPHRHRLTLKFDGVYRIQAEEGKTITINGQEYKSQQTVFLKSGNHSFNSNRAFRLRLIPENIIGMLDKRFKMERTFFPTVYTY